MLKKALFFYVGLSLLQFCKSPPIQDSTSTTIYALLSDSLIREFNKDSLTVFIHNQTHMEYEYKGFNATLFSYFKYDLAETDSALVINFVQNNMKPIEINSSDIMNHPLFINRNINFVSDKAIDLSNDEYFYAMNLKLSAIGFTQNRSAAAAFYAMRVNKKGWQAAGEIGYFLFRKVNSRWKLVNKRITNFIQ